jgi:glutathione S-transferase
MLVLTSLPFSPWSEKARWALDHHRIDYKNEGYIPILGEMSLRLRLRRPRGRVTVPVLYDGSTWHTDSFAIAKHADAIGSGPSLFPSGKLAEIAAWNERSEAALAAGRALLMLASAGDPELALAMLPAGVPFAIKPLLAPLARKGVEAFIAKYRMRDGESTHEAVLSRELETLAAALAGKRYLLGDALSYADITMAVVLQGLSPVDERYMARLPGVRPTASTTALAGRYAHLIEWRDELYAKHRRPSR